VNKESVGTEESHDQRIVTNKSQPSCPEVLHRPVSRIPLFLPNFMSTSPYLSALNIHSYSLCRELGAVGI